MDNRSRPPRRRREAGFLLLGVLATIGILGIMSGMAVQEWSIVEKREKEAELLFIQEQYAAAIIAYQKGQGALPTDLEQLKQKGQKGELYLRRPYVDPMTPKAKLEDWCLLRLAGTGQVASSCAAEGAADSGSDAFGNPSTFGSNNDEHTLVSKSTAQQNAGKFGTAKNPSTFGNFGQLGQEQGVARERGAGGLAGGTTGIIGVHSKSTDQAYNTALRGEERYDKWYYTTEDYKKDVSSRNIPGLPPRGGPGINNKKSGTGLQGGSGTTGFDSGSDRFGSGFGGSTTSKPGNK